MREGGEDQTKTVPRAKGRRTSANSLARPLSGGLMHHRRGQGPGACRFAPAHRTRRCGSGMGRDRNGTVEPEAPNPHASAEPRPVIFEDADTNRSFWRDGHVVLDLLDRRDIETL